MRRAASGETEIRAKRGREKAWVRTCSTMLCTINVMVMMIAADDDGGHTDNDNNNNNDDGLQLNLQCKAVQCCTVQFSVVQYNAVNHSTVK